MKEIIKYGFFLLVGVLIAQLWFKKKENNFQKEETQVILHGIENMSKLIVSEGTFSEVDNYQNLRFLFVRR